jgi:aldehyde dehydrogenase (NAD(P)+)
MMSPPWGGYPGADLKDPVSGIGFVHNTYMFDRPLKTVISGPLTQPLKPLWFAGNKAAPKVSQKVVDLYHRPSILKIPGLLIAALGG